MGADPKSVTHKPLVFALNGQRVELASVDPKTTLLSYIRSETRFKGPKRGCGEGGCGACLVMLARYNVETKQVHEASVNACLVLLCSVAGCAVITSEGLGNQRAGFHAIQRRISCFHASQCGFCTPGMTIAIYNHLKRDPHPTSESIERAIQGNICRCTGYRPILDVCKSFAADVDVEDLGLNTCWKEGEGDAAKWDIARRDSSAFPEFLVEELGIRGVEAAGAAWVSVRSVGELWTAVKEMGGRRVKMVVGNTSSGLYQDELADVDVFLDISQIPELITVSKSDHGVDVGAATRIADLMDHLASYNNPLTNAVASGLLDHLRKLASPHVRNWGSVGGNLVMAQESGFESDLATILIAAGTTVKTTTFESNQMKSRTKIIPLEEFLSTPSPAPHTLRLLLSVFIPLVSDSNLGTVFRSFRAAPRPYGNAVSYANAAFLVRYSGDRVVESVRVAFGAFGTKHAIRAVKVEEVLKGKALSLEVVRECVEVLKTEVVPADGTSKRAYCVSLVVGFLFQFLHSLMTKEETVSPTNLFPHIGKQNISLSEDQYPLSQPTAKFLALQQASGEAIYCDDIPSPPHCLYAAFVLSTKPNARIKGIDASAALESVGAADFLSVKDIPKGGKNVGLFNPFIEDTEEMLFAEDIVRFVGQPLGILIADSYDHARLAAKKVHVDYDTTSVGPPVMNCHDALAQGGTMAVVHAPSPPNSIGNIEKAIAEAEFKLEGKVFTKSQYHFYMETQTSLAIPDEDESMTIYTACQGVDPVQQNVAKCLNLPINNVRVITRRLGGGFGGKFTRNIQISTAVALAAHKLKAPVRISLDRNTDMQMVGGRAPTESIYTVTFTKTGQMTALKLHILVESGWYPEVNKALPLLMSGTLKKYNWGTFQVTYTICKTNNVPKTSVRAPGHCEASTIADAIMNKVATFLNMSGNKIRDINLHSIESFRLFHGDVSGFTLPEIWQRGKVMAELEEREGAIMRSNEGSRWVKRGVAIVPSVFGVRLVPTSASVSLFQDGSVVVEVGGVEMGQGLYTKVRQAVAFSLSPLCNKRKDVDMVSKIRVLQQDSFSLPNTFADGASTTSEGSCAAASQACEVLVQRLLPIQAKLGAEGSWENLCMTARKAFVDLQVHVLWTPVQDRYISFGVGVSEVEINVLSGETRILRSDLVYDAGESLNIAVDVGQVEGAFVMGIGYYLTEDIERDNEGKLLSDGTWTYMPPTIDTIPQKLNVELFNNPAHKGRIFSSKAVGEPPLLLAGSVYAAMHQAIAAARKDYLGPKFAGPDAFEFNPPATIDKVKTLCGLDNVERYIESQLQTTLKAPHGKLL